MSESSGDPDPSPSSSVPPEEPATPGAQPLAPGASVEDILARARYLSASEGAAEPSAPDADTRAPVAWTAAATSDPPAAPPKRRRTAGLLAGGAIGLLVVLAKVGLKLFAVGAVAAGLSGMFGSSWDKVPADQRDALERRFDAAVGSGFDSLSADEQQARLRQMVGDGSTRLDDASLASWERLDQKALAATDTATCAKIGTAWFFPSESVDATAVAEAYSHAYDSLGVEDFTQLATLNVMALEAAARQSPAVHASIPDATIGPIVDTVMAGLTADEQRLLTDLTSGSTASDAAICGLVRAIDTQAARLPESQFQAWAVWLTLP
jgi:hypothetical protein